MMSENLKSLNQVFSEHYRVLVFWCRRRMPAYLGEPEDLIHLAYLRCRKTWTAKRQSQLHQLSYIYRTLQWVLIDAIRSNQARSHREGLYGTSRFREDSWSLLQNLIGSEAIAKLPNRSRDICLGLLAGKTRQELSDELSLSKGSIAVYLSQAKSALIESLDIDAS